MPAPVVLDGSHGEGGGQIVRTALLLSVLTQRPVRIERVRGGRSRPGLKAQHVGVVRVLEAMTGGHATGADVGSPALDFLPGPPRPGTYRHQVGTAGAVTLLLQTLLPVALLTPGRVHLELDGGTDVPFSPTTDWFLHVLLPRLRPLANRLDVTVTRRGFFPAGGGRLAVTTQGPDHGGDLPDVRRLVAGRLGTPQPTPSLVHRVRVASLAHDRLQSARVAQRQAEAARRRLAEAGLRPEDAASHYVAASSVGTAVAVWLEDALGNRLGGDAVGTRGVPAEAVGRAAADHLAEDWAAGATVDRHMADHWAPWVALGAGAVRVPRTTGHLTTNLWVCRQFLGQGCARLAGRVLSPAPPPP